MPDLLPEITTTALVDYKRHLITRGTSIVTALKILNELATDAIIFVVDENDKLIGSLTDGDIRRGFLNGLTLEDEADKFSMLNPKFFQKGNYTIEQVIHFREYDYKIIPVLCKEGRIINIVNFRLLKSYLPVDAVIMAGGRGDRLKPLTDHTPKPLLKVGGKPIMEHNLDRLVSFGIDDFWISVNYLGNQIEEYFSTGEDRNINIRYVKEDEPLGTIGAVSRIKDFENDYVLITNSDLLTNINYEHFFLNFLKQEADFAVVSIPYQVNIPNAVLETFDGNIISLKEKPTYTYYSNGGIYLMKKHVLQFLPENKFFNATDLIELLIQKGKKVISYPLAGYWLDVGKPEDFAQAQQDIHQIKF